MKIVHEHFTDFLREIIQHRLEQIDQERSQLQTLLPQLEDLDKLEAAKMWLETIQARSQYIITSKQIADEQGVHRNYIAKITWDVFQEGKIKKEVNLLPGLSLSSTNIYFRDVYDLWKRIREEDKYPEGGEFERKRILQDLPESERPFLK